MAPETTRLYDICADVLAVIVAGLDDPPARQFVSAGAPAHDCELVAVWCERTAGHGGDIAADLLQAQMGAGHAMRYGTLVVTTVRCAPTPDDRGTPPPPEAESAAALTLYSDAQQTLNLLVAAEKAGTLPGCSGLAFADWRPLGPQGGLVASELRVRVNLSAGL